MSTWTNTPSGILIQCNDSWAIDKYKYAAECEKKIKREGMTGLY